MYKLYFDGSVKPNPCDRMGLGCVIYKDNKVEKEMSQLLVKKGGTNNISEYAACYLGVATCRDAGIKNLKVYGDSELVIKQMKGEYKVRNERLKKIHQHLKMLCGDFDSITFHHIPRARNSKADGLANKGLEN